MFRGARSIETTEEYQQRDKEKSKNKKDQNIFNDSFLGNDLGNCHIQPPSTCLDYVLRLQLDLVQPRRFAVVIFAAKVRSPQSG
jgi:hypothetical protein